MSRILMVTLTPQEEADIAGWVSHYASFPAEVPTRLVLSDRSPERFWQIARQFGIVPPQWQAVPKFSDPADYSGSVDPDAMTKEDWRVYTQVRGLWNRKDIFSKDPTGHPNGQDAGDAGIMVNLDAYAGVFSPYLVKR